MGSPGRRKVGRKPPILTRTVPWKPSPMGWDHLWLHTSNLPASTLGDTFLSYQKPPGKRQALCPTSSPRQRAKENELSTILSHPTCVLVGHSLCSSKQVICPSLSSSKAPMPYSSDDHGMESILAGNWDRQVRNKTIFWPADLQHRHWFQDEGHLPQTKDASKERREMRPLVPEPRAQTLMEWGQCSDF